VILDGWSSFYPDASLAPLQLKGWHVAFFVVGLPGLLMAAWVWTLKEPVRGQSEGITTESHPHPFREAWNELSTMIPPFHIMRLLSLGAGVKDIFFNFSIGLVIAAVAYALLFVTGNAVQWIALGIGVYVAFCWAQSLSFRDPATFAMIFKCKTVLLTAIGFPSIALVTYGIGFWGPPFFQRVHGVSASEAGMVLGLSTAIGGLIGVTFGGVLADLLRSKYIRAKFYVGIASIVLSVPSALGLLLSDDVVVAYVFNFLFALTSPMWIGPAASTINDLVMPRMRAISSAFYMMMLTFIGLALGPYTMGQISDTLALKGLSSAEALTSGMLWGLSAYVVGLASLILATFYIREDEESRMSRAQELESC